MLHHSLLQWVVTISQNSNEFVLDAEEGPVESQTTFASGHYEVEEIAVSQIYGEFYNQMSCHEAGESLGKF